MALTRCLDCGAARRHLDGNRCTICGPATAASAPTQWWSDALRIPSVTTSRTKRRWLFALAVVLHVGVGLFCSLAASVVAPASDIVALWAAWFVLLGAIVALRSRPSLCLAIPFVAMSGFIVAVVVLSVNGTGRWHG